MHLADEGLMVEGVFEDDLAVVDFYGGGALGGDVGGFGAGGK